MNKFLKVMFIVLIIAMTGAMINTINITLDRKSVV